MSTSKARLECLYKLRQVSREWKKSLKGFEWHSLADMMGVLKWSETFGSLMYRHKNACSCVSEYSVTHT